MTLPGLARDIFPASVRSNGTAHPKARVLVDRAGRMVIWAQVGHELQKIADAKVASVDRDRTLPRRWSITTVDGEEWKVDRGGGCGCGSPLRRLTGRRAFA